MGGHLIPCVGVVALTQVLMDGFGLHGCRLEAMVTSASWKPKAGNGSDMAPN